MKTVASFILRTSISASLSSLMILPAFAQQNAPAVTIGKSGQPSDDDFQPSTVQTAPPSRSPQSSVSGGERGPISVAPPETMQVPTTPLTPKQTNTGDDGTVVVGDKEAPIGLFITPWKDGYAENGLDRPARFVDVDTSPIDPDTFQRRVNYYNVITDYRQAHLASGK
jgi:hypothetical protein